VRAGRVPKEEGHAEYLQYPVELEEAQIYNPHTGKY